MGLFAVWYFLVLIAGVVWAFFAVIARLILGLCIAVADHFADKHPEPVEVVVPPRVVVAEAQPSDGRSLAEARLDRYCQTC